MAEVDGRHPLESDESANETDLKHWRLRSFKEHHRGLFDEFLRALDLHYRDLDLASTEDSATLEWYRLAGKGNPNLAFLFTDVVNIVNLAFRGCSESIANPIEYLEERQFTIIGEWDSYVETQQGYLRDDRPNPLVGQQQHRFREAYGSLSTHRDEIWELIASSGPLRINLEPALRAVDNLIASLSRVETALSVLAYEMLKVTDAPTTLHTDMSSTRTTLRRRRVGQNEHESEGTGSQESDSPPSPPAQLGYAFHARWNEILALDLHSPYRSILTTLMSVTRLSIGNLEWLIKPSQANLSILCLLFGGVAGVILGTGLAHSRPTDCATGADTLDDNFYTLISQLLLQLLALYCILIPVVRDRAAELHSLRFGLALGVSAIAAIIAPTLYQWSWQASGVASFASSLAALTASVQLAGGIQQHQNGPDLARG